MKPIAFIERFSFVCSICTLEITSGINASTALEIIEKINCGASNLDLVRLLLSAAANRGSQPITEADARLLSDDEIEHIAERIVHDREQRKGLTIGRDAKARYSDILISSIKERSQRLLKPASQIAAARLMAQLPLTNLAGFKSFSDVGSFDSAIQVRPVAVGSLLPNAMRELPSKSEIAIGKVTDHVTERKAGLRQGYLISLLAVSSPGEAPFPVAHMEASGEFVILHGIDSKNAKAAVIVQHYSQLNIKIIDVAEAYPIGFGADL